MEVPLCDCLSRVPNLPLSARPPSPLVPPIKAGDADDATPSPSPVCPPALVRVVRQAHKVARFVASLMAQSLHLHSINHAPLPISRYFLVCRGSRWCLSLSVSGSRPRQSRRRKEINIPIISLQHLPCRPTRRRLFRQIRILHLRFHSPLFCRHSGNFLSGVCEPMGLSKVLKRAHLIRVFKYV